MQEKQKTKKTYYKNNKNLQFLKITIMRMHVHTHKKPKTTTY